MSSQPPSVSIVANPIPVFPGPDFHVRQFLHDTFDRYAARGVLFNPDMWSEWTDAEIAEVVRCAARDYLATEGNGFDWVSAATRAEFVIAGTYNEVASDSNNWPAPFMSINFYDPFFEEGLELQMGPPSDIEMDPIPGMEAIPVPTNSMRSSATLRMPPTGDAMAAADGALVEGVRQLGRFFENNGPLPLKMMGSMLTLWRGLQASHHVRAGAVYRGIHNPDRAEVRTGEMKLVYTRSSPRITAVLKDNPEEANLFLD